MDNGYTASNQRLTGTAKRQRNNNN